MRSKVKNTAFVSTPYFMNSENISHNSYLNEQACSLKLASLQGQVHTGRPKVFVKTLFLLYIMKPCSNYEDIPL